MGSNTMQATSGNIIMYWLCNKELRLYIEYVMSTYMPSSHDLSISPLYHPFNGSSGRLPQQLILFSLHRTGSSSAPLSTALSAHGKSALSAACRVGERWGKQHLISTCRKAFQKVTLISNAQTKLECVLVVFIQRVATVAMANLRVPQHGEPVIGLRDAGGPPPKR